MTRKNETGRSEAREEETRFLAGALREPDRLRRRLVLAIAVSPPKARRGAAARRFPRRRR